MSYIGNIPTTAAFPFDQFSGNASTTAFTLTYAPAGSTSILVSVSGVTQNPNTYSCVGTTLTFTGAPPTGTNNIAVLYLGLPVIGVTSPGNTAYRTPQDFTATASQTTFNTASAYTVGFVDVYRNGARLGAADFTATNTTTVVLANACTAGDLVTIVYFTLTSIVNAVPQSGGTITGSLVVNGTTTMNGAAGSGYTGMKNRIINGSMAIDQRNGGGVVTQTATQLYTVDRWMIAGSITSKFTAQRNAGAITPPIGFTNYLGITSLSSYSVLAGDFFYVRQVIEGLNVADMAWGTASAAPITFSFWARSSLTGTFGGTVFNSAANRAYPFTYAINVANTWEYKTVSIAGDTTGTWATDSSGGFYVQYTLGYGTSGSGAANAWNAGTAFAPTGATSVVGTSGATFYVTGVQLERGSNSTSFEFIDYGRQLQMCYRYYRRYSASNAAYTGLGGGVTISASSLGRWGFPLDTPMRTVPTPSFSSCVGFNGTVGGAITGGTNYSSTNFIDIDLTTSGMGSTVGLTAKILMSGSSSYVELTGAEL